MDRYSSLFIVGFALAFVLFAQSEDTCPNNRQEHDTGKGACGRFYNTCPDGFECLDNGLCCGEPGSAVAAARPTPPSFRNREASKPKPSKVDYDESDWEKWENELGDHENDDEEFENMRGDGLDESGGRGNSAGGNGGSSTGGGKGAHTSNEPCEDKTWKCFWRTSVGRCNSDNAKKYCAKTCGHCGGNTNEESDGSSHGGGGNSGRNSGDRGNNQGGGSNTESGGWGGSTGGGGRGTAGSSNEPCEDKSWKCFWRPSVGRCDSQNARTYCRQTCGHCGGGQANSFGGGEMEGFRGGGGPDGQFIKPEGRGCVRPCLSQFMGTLKSMNPGKICHSFRQVEWCVKECPTGWIAMKLLGPQLNLLRTKVAAFC